MTNQPTRTAVQLSVAIFVIGMHAATSLNLAFSQEIKYEDRIGSNKDFDMCEDFRFKQITKLVNEGKISQQQGYNIWKRIRSDKDEVKNVLSSAVAANELTQNQADRLLPLIDAKMTYLDSRHGRFGQPKDLVDGQFKPGEVSTKNRAAIYQRLVAANQLGKVYDYDVASIMKQLYAGFDQEKAPLEEVAIYRGALNPRIAQSGSQTRVLQMAQMQRDQKKSGQKSRAGYGGAELKIVDPADWIKDLEKPIYSGPQPGEKVPSLTMLNLRGDKAGQQLDPIELAGDKLHLMFFVSQSRTFGRFLGQLRKQLQSIEDNSNKPWAMSVIVCTDDANEAEKSFAVLDQRYPKSLVVGLSQDGSAGPPAYGLDKNLTATVIVAKKGKVLHNLPYAGNAFYTQPHILGAIAKAMEVDHDTLRKYISDTPGDAAAQAYGRGMQRKQEDSKTPEKSGFREKITPLVVNNKITRADAGELLRTSGNETGLKSKVEELLNANKITREEAKELLSTEPVDGKRRRGEPNR
jgi:hypothetical protein